MMEHLIVWAIVFAAVIYLIRHFRAQFRVKQHCGGGCQKCTVGNNQAKSFKIE